MKQSSLFGNDMPKKPKFFEKLRKQAKRLKKAKGIRQHEALDEVAQAYGFANWDAVAKAEKDALSISTKVAPPTMIDEFKDDPEPERSGDLTDEQKRILAYNREFLARHGIDYAVFEPTRTGMKKSIFDATQPVRLLFEKEGFHTYRHQGRTPKDKVIKPAFFVRPDREPEETDARFYRPKTKKGDPRMWFPRIQYFADPGDQVAIIFHKGFPYLVILSKARFPDPHDPVDRVASFLRSCIDDRDAIARELLQKLRALAGKPIATQKIGPTAVGTELELKLGLQTNSNKMPDYKGIELKTGRLGKTGRSMNRTTLFAQVAEI